MEWLWSVVLIAILFGPIVWVVVKDRKGGAPAGEDAPNMTGWGAIIKEIIGRGPHGGGGSGSP